jgi:hypothetical protein
MTSKVLRGGVGAGRWFLVLGGVLLGSLLWWGSGQAASRQASGAAGGTLVARWPLDTISELISGPKWRGAGLRVASTVFRSTPDVQSGCDAYLQAPADVDRAPGRFGSALAFDQTFRVAQSGCASSVLAPQQFTVMAWVMASHSPGPSRYLLAKGSGRAGQCSPAAWGMYTSFAGDVNAGGLYFYVNHGGQGYHAPGVPASRIWDGRWHSVAGSFDGATARFYLDGAQVGNGTSVPGAVDYSQPLNEFQIGGYGPYPPNSACSVPTSFVGSIDEVRIYSGALDSGDVQRIADFGGSNPPPPIVPAPPASPPPSPPVSDAGSAAPVLHTTGVDQITASSARVNGTIDNGEHVQAPPYQVEYGKTTAYGQKTALQTMRAAGYVTRVSVTLTGLEPGTEYHARLVSPWTTRPGEDVVFRTSGTAAPALPTTTIALDPAQPQAGGFYQGFVNVRVIATGQRPLDTRCALDPTKAPASFGDLPSGCQFSSGGRVTVQGKHIVYAATRDAAGRTSPLVSRAFTISFLPDTTITSGPDGATWRPNNLFYFTSTDLPATYECALDGKPFAACTSPFETGVLGAGAHTFAVRATAPGGAVDPTPAEAKFSINAAVSARADCYVQPVRYWLITGWDYNGRSVDENDKSVCEIGTPGKVPCSHLANCVVKIQPCPYGARCTITTKGAWFDADKAINWGLRMVSTVGRFIPIDSGGFVPSVTYRARIEPTKQEFCETGFTGDRCYKTATLQVLGGSNKWLLSACEMDLVLGRTFGYNVPSTDAAEAFLGPDNIRRIECNAEWRVEPAPELAAVPAGRLVEVNTIGAGVLVALATILGGDDRVQAAAGAAATVGAENAVTPRIAAVRKVVRRAGPVAVPLRLNAPAQRLLKQKKQLTVRLRLGFTAKGRKQVVRTQLVTITAPVARRRTCALPQPTTGANPRSVKLPPCLTGKKK